MAIQLTSGSTDRIEHGDKLGWQRYTEYTTMALYRPAAGFGDGGILTTGGYVGPTKWRNTGIHSSGRAQASHTRGAGATGQLITRGLTILSTGTWYFIATRIRQNGVAGDQQVWIAALGALLADNSDSGVQAMGSGTFDTFDDILTTGGNYGTGHTWGEAAGELAWVAQWNRYLSPEDMWRQQMDLTRIVQPIYCRLFCHYGVGGNLGSQRDWTGYGNDGLGVNTAAANAIAFYEHPVRAIPRIEIPYFRKAAAAVVVKRRLALLGVGR